MRQTLSLSLLAHLGRETAPMMDGCVSSSVISRWIHVYIFSSPFFLLTTFVFGHKKKDEKNFLPSLFFCSQLRGATKLVFLP